MTVPVAAPALVRLGRVDSTQAVAFALAGSPMRSIWIARPIPNSSVKIVSAFVSIKIQSNVLRMRSNGASVR